MRLAALARRLFEPIDIAPLVLFRVAFGALMAWEVWRYFQHDWIARYYVEPAFHFTYFGFDWVRPWPGDGMIVHFAVLGGLAICIAAGFLYRLATILFFVGFTWVFLLDQARYLNHFYLIGLLSFLLIFVPAHRSHSVDALLRPAIRADRVPAWTVGILALQVAIVYVYGGIAKLNPDWLRGEPMRMWLADGTDFPVIGPLFTQEWVVYLFSYGGLLLDLLAIPLLLWRRTRLLALAGVTAFHLMNANLFTIGVFPWMMIAAAVLFLPPAWSRRALDWLAGSPQATTDEALGAAGPAPPPGPTTTPARRRLVVGLLAAYVAVQLLLPFRHLVYPGDVAWTEEGHRFSWRMKLRDKVADATFLATDPSSGETWDVDPLDYLTPGQYDEMSARPDMILQLAHHIADDLRSQGYDEIEVRADATASLNGRRPQVLIDPSVDLAAQPRDLLPARWILPLEDTPPGVEGGAGVEEFE